MIARVAALIVTAGMCAAIAFARRPRLPDPTGPWAVGTVLASAGSIGTSSSRRVVRVWYPASDTAGVGIAPYHFGARGLTLRDRLVGMFVRTRAYVGAPFDDGRFPVVIYVPGFGGRFYHNSSLAQELASHGYVVVGMDDTQPSNAFDYSSVAGAKASFAEGNRKVLAQTRDVVELIDSLRVRDADTRDVLSHRLALDRIGLVGFSFGGAVAAEAAVRDGRVRAAVDLDGSIYARALGEGVSKPFLYACSNGYDETDSPLALAFDRENFVAVKRGFRKNGGFLLQIDGMKHYNFTDTPILPSFRHTGVGTIDGRRGVSIVARYVLAFFDRVLKGRHESLFDERNASNGVVTLTRFEPPQYDAHVGVAASPHAR